MFEFAEIFDVENNSPLYMTTLQRNFDLCIPRKGTARTQYPIFAFMCLWAIYIFPQSVHLFSWSRICRPMVGIFKSYTETWMYLCVWGFNEITCGKVTHIFPTLNLLGSLYYAVYMHAQLIVLSHWPFKGTQDWDLFWLRFWNLYYFFIIYVKILRFYKKNSWSGHYWGRYDFSA